jgi:hypothetical protein
MQKADLMLQPLLVPAHRSAPVRGKHGPAIAVGLGGLVFLLYGFSFVLPATGRMLGYQAFMMSVLFVLCIPMWLANPVFWYGLVRLCQGRCESAARAGLLALVLALSECWMFWGELSTGYFLWAGSMALLALLGWCGSREVGLARTIRVVGVHSGDATRIAARFRQRR